MKPPGLSAWDVYALLRSADKETRLVATRRWSSRYRRWLTDATLYADPDGVRCEPGEYGLTMQAVEAALDRQLEIVEPRREMTMQIPMGGLLEKNEEEE